MRFEVAVNGEEKYIAGINGDGHVGVHVNARGDSEYSSVHASAYDNISKAETIFHDWIKLRVNQGDVIQIRCLGDGAISMPLESRSSRNDERIAIRNPALAEELHELLRSTDRSLLSFLDKVKATESPEDYKRFARAVGHFLSEVSDQFLGPIYNAHPGLRPAELGGVPL
jgi:hypothetical protein